MTAQRDVDEHYLRRAIDMARRGIIQGQTPFGCCIVKNDAVIALAHNTVWRDMNITAHAEINAIEQACADLQTIDLSGGILYTTCEPCPMCFSAAHWARLSRIVFGARIQDARDAGFNELVIDSERMRALGGSPLVMTPEVLREESIALFKEWAAGEACRVY